MTKRCKFCGHKLDDSGLCQNTNCADYERTKIIETAEKSTATTADSTSSSSSNQVTG